MSKKAVCFFKILASTIFILGCFFYQNPLFFFQQTENLFLKAHQVEFKKTPHFNYFEKNNCVGSRDCQCVLLVHGLGDFAYTWSQTLESSRFQNTRFFAINLFGVMESSVLESKKYYAISHQIELIQLELLSMCPSWSVVGNSYGGWLSLRLAQKDPRVQRAMLLAPAGLPKDYTHIASYFMNPTIESARHFYHLAYFAPKRVPDFIFSAIVDRAKQGAAVEMIKAVLPEDYLQTPMDLKKKVTLIWGDSDGIIPTQWAQEYQAHIVGANLKVLNNCGHLPQKECFSDFERELTDFLNLKKAMP